MPESKELRVLREKTERYLKDLLSSFEVASDRYLVRNGSTALQVHPVQWGEDSTILRVIAMVLRNVKRDGNEKMFEEFSTLNDHFLFGKLYWSPDKDGVGTIYLEHNLLGDFLDLEELKHSLFGLAISADKLDDELKSRYGGERWSD